MPLWFGLGKRIETLKQETTIGFKHVTDQIGEIRDILTNDDQTQPTQLEQPARVDVSPRLSAIEREMLETTDPERLVELEQASRVLRRFQRDSRASHRRRFDYLNRSRVRDNGELDEEGEDLQVPGIDIKKGLFDPTKFIDGILNNAGTIKALGLDKRFGFDMDAIQPILQQAKVNPEIMNRLGVEVGSKIFDILKGVATSISKPQPQATALASPPTGQGAILVQGPGGQVIDPRYPYKVSG